MKASGIMERGNGRYGGGRVRVSGYMDAAMISRFQPPSLARGLRWGHQPKSESMVPVRSWTFFSMSTLALYTVLCCMSLVKSVA